MQTHYHKGIQCTSMVQELNSCQKHQYSDTSLPALLEGVMLHSAVDDLACSQNEVTDQGVALLGSPADWQ